MSNDYLNDEMEIDLLELLKCLLKNIKQIIIATLVCGILTFGVTQFLLPKSYSSSIDIAIQPQGELLDYTSYLKGNNVLSKVNSKVKMNIADLVECITVTRDTNNPYNYTITANTKNPTLSYKIVKEVVKVFKKELSSELNLFSVITVNEARINTRPTSPNIKKNTLVGLFFGFIGSVVFVIMCFLFDKHFKNKDEVEAYLGVDALAEIPVNK